MSSRRLQKAEKNEEEKKNVAFLFLVNFFSGRNRRQGRHTQKKKCVRSHCILNGQIQSVEDCVPNKAREAIDRTGKKKRNHK